MNRGGQGGTGPEIRRRFRGQFVRRRAPSGRYQRGSFSDDRDDSSPPPPPQQHVGNQNHRHNRPNYPNGYNSHHKSREPQSDRTEMDEIRDMLQKVNLEIGKIQNRLSVLEEQSSRSQQRHSSSGEAQDQVKSGSKENIDQNDKESRRKAKLLRQKARKAAKQAEKRAAKVAEKKAGDVVAKSTKPTVSRKRKARKVFPELSEDELNEIVQTLKQRFINYEKPIESIKGVMNEKGPTVVYEFCSNIFDYAICDVASPTKLLEIADNLFQLLVSEDNNAEVDFQKGFYDALTSISKREEEIAIDAPRYLDIIGHILAQCLVNMFNKHKYMINKFLNKCLRAYSGPSRGNLLASIMKSIAAIKNERFGKEIWNMARLSWERNLPKDTNVEEFLNAQDVKYTTQTFSPEPKGTRTSPKELQEFADEVTSLVEKQCTSKTLEDLLKGLQLEKEEEVDYLGTLMYAIVRGCISPGSSDDYKLDIEALNKYSSLLVTQHNEHNDIALQALTALTKLWHEFNCPQDLMRSILNALHTKGAAPLETLDRWLNSPNLANIPGIGAARLSSKRYIEDLGNSLKAAA